jgi:hypothetical protein
LPRLSVVVKSTSAEVFTLDYKQFATLPEALQAQLKAGLLKAREFDDLNIDAIAKLDEKWEILK